MFRLRSSWFTFSVGLIQKRQSALKDHLGDHSKISRKIDWEKAMKQNYKNVAEDLQKSVGQLAKELPDTMKAFSSLGAAAKKTGADTESFDAKLNRSKNPISRFLSTTSFCSFFVRRRMLMKKNCLIF